MQPRRPLERDPEFLALRAQVNRISRRLGVGSDPVVAAGTVTKRFRVAAFVTPLTILGGTVTGPIKWSTPMPSAVYNVDAACTAMATSGTQAVITNQTAEGCTVSFVAPILLAAGTVVIVLGISPATIT